MANLGSLKNYGPPRCNGLEFDYLMPDEMFLKVQYDGFKLAKTTPQQHLALVIKL